MKNKKAQISDTFAWAVATILIVVLIIGFIFISSMLANTRILKGDFKNSLFSKSISDKTDLSLTKSLITYYTMKEDTVKKTLDKELKKMNSTLIFKGNYDLRAVEIMRRVAS